MWVFKVFAHRIKGVRAHRSAEIRTQAIGRGTRIWQFAVVGNGVQIGVDCNIGAHVFIESEVKIGNRVTIKNGDMLWKGVTIENDVFIGTGVCFTNAKKPISGRQASVLSKTNEKRTCNRSQCKDTERLRNR